MSSCLGIGRHTGGSLARTPTVQHQCTHCGKVVGGSTALHSDTTQGCQSTLVSAHCISTIVISHKASPEQLERYATFYHFWYDPKHMERGPIKSRPDYHQTTRAVVSMNKAAGQTQKSKKTSQSPRGSGPREARLGFFMALSQSEMVLRGKPNLRFKFHPMASPRISRSVCLGKPRSIH